MGNVFMYDIYNSDAFRTLIFREKGPPVEKGHFHVSVLILIAYGWSMVQLRRSGPRCPNLKKGGRIRAPTRTHLCPS